MSAIERFWAVIPAGGAGTRLWPLSRAASPKFLHDLTGTGRSLLQGTWDRLEPLVGDRIMVVTGVAHADAVREQLPDLPGDQLVAEPSPRDSMAAIGLAAALLERPDPEAFRACVRAAVDVADDGYVVTIGIEPTHAATGFGYIRVGERIGTGPAWAAEEFVEKPSAATAAEYLATGQFRWNAGMFVVRVSVLLDLLATWHPDLAAGVREVAARPDALAARWDTLEKIAIHHAVAAPAAAAGRVAVVHGTFGWDDVGDFHSLATLLPDTPGGLKVLGDEHLVEAVDTTGVVVPAAGRTVAVVGLTDVVVVDTGDALLVTTRQRAQDVKGIVDTLKATGRARLT